MIVISVTHQTFKRKPKEVELEEIDYHKYIRHFQDAKDIEWNNNWNLLKRKHAGQTIVMVIHSDEHVQYFRKMK